MSLKTKTDFLGNNDSGKYLSQNPVIFYTAWFSTFLLLKKWVSALRVLLTWFFKNGKCEENQNDDDVWISFSSIKVFPWILNHLYIMYCKWLNISVVFNFFALGEILQKEEAVIKLSHSNICNQKYLTKLSRGNTLVKKQEVHSSIPTDCMLFCKPLN